MGGMGLTGAEDIRGAAWVGTWALVTRPIRELHRPFADLDVSTAPGECFDELREAHTELVSNHDLTDKCQRRWRTWVECREVVSPGNATNEAKAEPRFRFFPHGLTPAAHSLVDENWARGSNETVPAPGAATVHLWRAPL